MNDLFNWSRIRQMFVTLVLVGAGGYLGLQDKLSLNALILLIAAMTAYTNKEAFAKIAEAFSEYVKARLGK
jgi:hypothetical protein